MLESKLLKSYIVYKGLTMKEVASSIGISYNSFWQKVNKQRDFKGSEIKKLSEILEIPPDHVMKIFFEDDVDDMETNE